MNITDIPSKILKAFGINGQKNTIPVDSSTTTDSNGVATFDKGFPPITMQPLSAGGKPPAGKDMNGILNAITAQQQWQNAGGSYPFDALFATAIGGYPSGAMLPSSDFYGLWQNTIDGNSTPPENTSGALTGWVPHSYYGSSQVAITTSNVTLTTLQAARNEIILSGALTGNRYLYLPSWTKSWRIVNNCSGNFSVLVSTQSSSATVQSYPGTVMNVRGDGGGVYLVQPALLSSNGYQRFDSGLVIQWGLTEALPGATVNITYSIPFQTAAFIGIASKGAGITNSDYACGMDVTRTGAIINNGGNAAGSSGIQGIRWLVIGF
jgi:hypothetical protein